MRRPACNYRSSSLSLGSVFRLAFLFCLPLLSRRQLVFRQTRRITPPVVLSFAVMTLGLLSARAANAQVINYPGGFAGATSSSTGGSGPIWLENSAVLYGTAIQLTQSGAVNTDNNAWYETPVNVQAFTTTFTFAETCPTDCGEGFGFMTISVSNPKPAGYTYSGEPGAQFSWS